MVESRDLTLKLNLNDNESINIDHVVTVLISVGVLFVIPIAAETGAQLNVVERLQMLQRVLSLQGTDGVRPQRRRQRQGLPDVHGHGGRSLLDLVTTRWIARKTSVNCW